MNSEDRTERLDAQGASASGHRRTSSMAFVESLHLLDPEAGLLVC
ncbi:hypothetical protein [Streptomyces hirsutus]